MSLKKSAKTASPPRVVLCPPSAVLCQKCETVADIVAELRKGVKDWKGDTLHIFDDLAVRIERAHRRELSAVLRPSSSVESEAAKEKLEAMA